MRTGDNRRIGKGLAVVNNGVFVVELAGDALVRVNLNARIEQCFVFRARVVDVLHRTDWIDEQT